MLAAAAVTDTALEARPRPTRTADCHCAAAVAPPCSSGLFCALYYLKKATGNVATWKLSGSGNDSVDLPDLFETTLGAAGRRLPALPSHALFRWRRMLAAGYFLFLKRT